MYKVLLYYKYVNIPDAKQFAAEHLALCKKLNILGRIIIADEGINGTCAGLVKDIEKYKQVLKANSLFADVEFKESFEDFNPFHKIFVRYRDELVTLGKNEVKIGNKAAYMNPDELQKLYDSGEEFAIVDMRNEYEARVGRFKNALTFDVENFRELPEQIARINYLKDKKVVAYCTGGVRCEKGSALLRQSGFENVYQLHGGIDQYAKKYPKGYFEGKMYVFDSRVAVSFDQSEDRKIVAQCYHCGHPNDDYINCANASCNKRLIMCLSCQEKFQRSCSQDCARRSRYSVTQSHP